MISGRDSRGSDSRSLPRGRTEKTRLFPFVLWGVAVFLLCAFFLGLRRGIGVTWLVLSLRMGILIAAAISDLLTRRVRNFYAVAMLLTGFYGLGSWSAFLWRAAGALTVFLVFYIVYRCFPEKSPGGADIKMLAALTFVLGKGTVPVLVYLLGLCLLCALGLILWKKRELLHKKVPFFPILSAGVWLYYMI